MARQLDVYLNADLTGHLVQDDHGNLSFEYGEAWLAQDRAVPLSISLPLRSEPFNRRECRPFFAGLLPEEAQRQQVARTFGVSDRNDFALLEKIGGECAGAVSLMLAGQPAASEAWTYQDLSQEQLAAKLASLPKHPLLAGETGIRVSLAGAQSKMAVALREGRFALPLHGAPSTHILKPESRHFDHLVANEALCMQLGTAVGLDVAKAEVGHVGGTSFLLVARYDRRRLPEGTLERVHQEDFCQALGVAPELKYQQEGGPSLKQCFELVRSVSSAPALDVLRLFDAVVFNFLIGNGDAHGKNFSLLYNDGQTRLAPLYDLVCTQAYPEVDAQMAMKIGRHRDPSRVTLEDWRRFFVEAGLGAGQAQKRMLALGARVRESIESWKNPAPGQQPVIDCITTRLARLSHAWKLPKI